MDQPATLQTTRRAAPLAEWHSRGCGSFCRATRPRARSWPFVQTSPAALKAVGLQQRLLMGSSHRRWTVELAGSLRGDGTREGRGRDDSRTSPHRLLRGSEGSSAVDCLGTGGRLRREVGRDREGVTVVIRACCGFWLQASLLSSGPCKKNNVRRAIPCQRRVLRRMLPAAGHCHGRL